MESPGSDKGRGANESKGKMTFLARASSFLSKMLPERRNHGPSELTETTYLSVLEYSIRKATTNWD